MTRPQIDWEEYNASLILSMCVLEKHSHYLHYQIAAILNEVFDQYSIDEAQERAIWGVIERRNPEWLRKLSGWPSSHPDVRATIDLLERRKPMDLEAMPTYDELLNGRGALYLVLDELLGIPEGHPAGFSWRTY